MWHGRSISVVLPAYNEEQSIRAAVESYMATGVVDEVLVINNNSRDRTVEEASKTPAKILTETTQGYGAALTCGLKNATGDLVILAEPDGTFVSNDIFKLLAYCDDAEMVCGTRTTSELIWAEANMGWFLRMGNWVVAKMLQFLHNTCSLSDCGCTMRVIRRDALQKILPHLTVTRSHFLPEMVILAKKQGVKILEIPVNYRGREGVSKIKGNMKGILKTGFAMIFIIITYRFKR
jgi:glycosyltransferase involved in cell wall biosynthesis